MLPTKTKTKLAPYRAGPLAVEPHAYA